MLCLKGCDFSQYIERFRIIKNGHIYDPIYPVQWDDLFNSELLSLKNKENFPLLFLVGDSEFDKFRKLKDWVNKQWVAGNPTPYPPWNANIVLDWIRQDKTSGFCAQYAQVLLQSLLSLGYQARYIEIGSRDNPYAHFVIEVWSNEFNKWIVLDPDYNIHFEYKGVPMSAREVQYFVAQDRYNEFKVISGNNKLASDIGRWPYQTKELYYYLRYFQRANHLTDTAANPFDRVSDAVESRSPDVTPWEDSEVESQYPKEKLTTKQIYDDQQFNFSMNQTQVEIVVKSAHSVDLSLVNNMKQFSHYAIRALDESRAVLREWSYRGEFFEWRPTADEVLLTIVAVNGLGVEGFTAEVGYLR